MLRIDDTDAERSTDAFETDIRADLEWMGMDGIAKIGNHRGLHDMMKLLLCWLSLAAPMPAMKPKKNYRLSARPSFRQAAHQFMIAPGLS